MRTPTIRHITGFLIAACASISVASAADTPKQYNNFDIHGPYNHITFTSNVPINDNIYKKIQDTLYFAYQSKNDIDYVGCGIPAKPKTSYTIHEQNNNSNTDFTLTITPNTPDNQGDQINTCEILRTWTK